MSAVVALPLRIGARTISHVKRRLVQVASGLDQVLSAQLPALPPLPAAADGYQLLSLRADLLPALEGAHPKLKVFVRQRYRRSYARLDGSFDDYLESFSSKSRSTLRRKARKLAERSGGTLDLRRYSTPGEMDDFYRYARSVSARTYQEKLLDAGLPEGEAFLSELREQARQDAVRSWVLFLEGEPISYLYAPAEGASLIYSRLGYDPDHADLSPGTVLQFEAMRQLIEEGRFGLFDFTEGEGQHKRLFGTGWVDCIDLLLVRPTLGNLMAGHLLQGFDAAVGHARRAVSALRLEKLARAVTR